MQVKQAMTPSPVSVSRESPVSEIVRLLAKHRIGSVPVVEQNGRLVGLVTETDLFPRKKRVPFSTVTSTALFDVWAGPEHMPDVYKQFRGRTAGDIMTPAPVSVDSGADITQAIRMMVETDRKHLPVVEEGRLVGILTRHDVLRALCADTRETKETLRCS